MCNKVKLQNYENCLEASQPDNKIKYFVKNEINTNSLKKDHKNRIHQNKLKSAKHFRNNHRQCSTVKS